MICDWCVLICFTCFCVSLGSLLLIVLFWEIVDKFAWKIFLIFLIFTVTYKNKGNWLPPSLNKLIFHSPLQFPFAIHWSKVIHSFVFADQAGWSLCIVICVNPTPLKWLRGQTNPKSLWSLQNMQWDTTNFTVNLLEIAFFRELRVFVSCKPLKLHDFVISLKKDQ